MSFKKFFGVILTLNLAISALATPQEKKELSINRDVATGNTVRGELSLNVYKQEPYEADYTVQVPYQTTETYYEQVPYQDTETYTERIPRIQEAHQKGRPG